MYFTEEHEVFRESFKDFLQKEVVPHIEKWEKTGNIERFIWTKFGEMGYFGLSYPEEYGGLNLDLFYMVIFLEELQKINSGGFAAAIWAHVYLAMTHLNKEGDERIKRKYLSASISGEKIGCLCVTEPFGGSDVAGMKTTAVKDGDHFVINGAKRYTSLIGESKLIVFYARTDPDAPMNKGVTAFLLDGSEEGISFGQTHNKMGYRLYPNRESYYDNVRVHRDNVLGEVNGAAAVRAHAFRGSAELAACNTGLARSLYKICYEHAKERVQGGKPIIEHLTIRHMLAEMIMNIEVAEQFMWRICWGAENDETFTSRFTRSGKVFSDKVGLKTIELGLDVLGGMGIMREGPSEKIVRDILTFLHGDGTDSATLLEAANTLESPA